MRRRDVLALLTGVATLRMAGDALGQAGRVARIAYLGTGSTVPLLQEAFQQGLREAGWVVGENVVLDSRYAEGQDARLPALASELVLLKPDVIVASPTPATLAAKRATDSVPIVGIGLDNPIRHGLIASLARPGGNVTGLAYGDGPEIFGKDLELLRALIPDLRRVAVLSNSSGPNHAPMLASIADPTTNRTTTRGLAISSGRA